MEDLAANTEHQQKPKPQIRRLGKAVTLLAGVTVVVSGCKIGFPSIQNVTPSSNYPVETTFSPVNCSSLGGNSLATPQGNLNQTQVNTYNQEVSIFNKIDTQTCGDLSTLGKQTLQLYFHHKSYIKLQHTPYGTFNGVDFHDPKMDRGTVDLYLDVGSNDQGSATFKQIQDFQIIGKDGEVNIGPVSQPGSSKTEYEIDSYGELSGVKFQDIDTSGSISNPSVAGLNKLSSQVNQDLQAAEVLLQKMS